MGQHVLSPYVNSYSNLKQSQRLDLFFLLSVASEYETPLICFCIEANTVTASASLQLITSGSVDVNPVAIRVATNARMRFSGR